MQDQLTRLRAQLQLAPNQIAARRMQAALEVARALAEARKDRSADYLICGAKDHPSLEGVRAECKQASIAQRLDAVTDLNRPLEQRAVFAWYASGLEGIKAPSRPRCGAPARQRSALIPRCKIDRAGNSEQKRLGRSKLRQAQHSPIPRVLRSCRDDEFQGNRAVHQRPRPGGARRCGRERDATGFSARECSSPPGEGFCCKRHEGRTR